MQQRRSDERLPLARVTLQPAVPRRVQISYGVIIPSLFDKLVNSNKSYFEV